MAMNDLTPAHHGGGVIFYIFGRGEPPLWWYAK